MLYILISILIIFAVPLFIGVLELFTGKRTITKFNALLIKDLSFAVLIAVPYFVGIYLLSSGTSFPYESSYLPDTEYTLLQNLLYAIVGLAVLTYFFFRIFQKKDMFRQSLPFVISLSFLTGIANTSFIFLVVNSIHFEDNRIFLLYYFLLALITFIISRKIAETRLIRLMLSIIYQYRLKLIDKILFASYRDFEKIDRGRVLEILSGDTKRIGSAAGMLVAFMTYLVSVICAFAYLATISLLATGFTLLVTIFLAALYMFVSSKAQRHFEHARDTENTFMSYVNGAINGFKELTINPLKKNEYKAEFEEICDKYRSSQGIANIQFVNISLFGNVLIMALIGSLVFALPAIIPDIKLVGLMGYVMVLLYIIGPVDAIVHMFPGIIEIKVSWRRIQNFIKELETPKHIGEVPELSDRRISSLEVQDITFSYQKNEDENFTLGPVNFRLEGGCILFVIGGNGSGKTTLGKLLTGLYHPENGSILVDGNAIEGNNLGNYFSTVFSDFHLFKRIYGIDEVSHEKSEDLLNLFQLNEKVKIRNNEYSTIELSNGQRKRLALLQCFLEDKPVYLFDEWAADQDPVFRKFFYHKLLPSMKDQGKIVIAITHDDHYFDMADTIIKLDTGKQEYIKQPDLTKTDIVL